MASIPPKEAAEAYNWYMNEVSKSQAGVTTQVIDLTPARARVLIANNPDNRNVRQTKVDDFTRDMRGGAWAFNGEAMIVAKDGWLNDGQHRAMAVAISGVTIKVVMVFGVERETRTTLDQGIVREMGDYLTMMGFPDGKNLGAVGRMVFQWRNIGFVTQSIHYRPTKSEITKIVTETPAIAESLRVVGAINVQGSVSSQPMLAFCHYAFSTVAPAEATAFIKDLMTGAGLPDASPILYARNRLLSEKLVMTSTERAELIFRAWGAWRRGEARTTRLPLRGGELPLVE